MAPSKIGWLSAVFGGDSRTIVVAEIGNNHEGDFKLAQEMVRAAAASGADAVKFQHLVPHKFIAASENVRLARLRQYALSDEELLSLFELARECSVVPFATAFDVQTLRWICQHQRVIKIASGDNNYLDLLATAGQSEMPTLISTGLLTLDDITKLHQWWLSRFMTPILFLHCVTAYPAPVHSLNLRSIERIASICPDVAVGYSDHSIGTTAPIAAVALGAVLIEKHFTLSHHLSDFRDHQLSATPDQFSDMVCRIRDVEQSLGDGQKVQTDDERSILESARRSAAASRFLGAGSQITEDDLIFLRPGHGYSPDDKQSLLGRTLIRDLSAGQIILRTDLAAQ